MDAQDAGAVDILTEKMNEVEARLMTKLDESVSKILKNNKENGREAAVPSRIKDAVHKGFRDGTSKGLEWRCGNGNGYMSADNVSMTRHVRDFAKSLYPEDSADIERSIKTYFRSRREAKSRKDDPEARAAKARVYARKVTKMNRRLAALEKKTSLNEMEKRRYRKVMRIKDIHSSEEDSPRKENLVIRHRPWDSEHLKVLKESLDRKSEQIQSVRSRKQTTRRRDGRASMAPIPANLAEDQMWAIKK